ncbi:MAG: TrmB family transcriptional regulator [Nitrososphaerota archaeon]|nr:TrmB family transcriptional regulator [Nitrososphaerota archaeon]
MDLGEKAIKSLVYLGLSEYEIKVYSALLQGGPLTASELSKSSGVPYSKIYDILNSLEEKGWIDDDKERPSKYFPCDPEAALNTSKARIDRTFEISKQSVLDEIRPIYEKVETRERPEIWVVRGEKAVLEKTLEIIQNASSELKLAIPAMVAGQYGVEELLPLIKPIKCYFLVSDNGLAGLIKSSMPSAEVKIRDGMFGGGVIGDLKRVLLLLGRGDSGSPYLAISAEHPGLAIFADSYFKYLWESSSYYNSTTASGR